MKSYCKIRYSAVQKLSGSDWQLAKFLCSLLSSTTTRKSGFLLCPKSDTGCDSKFAKSAPVYCICPHVVIHMTLIKSSNVMYSWYLCANILEKRCTWYLDKYSIFSNTCSNSFHQTSLIYTKFYPKQHCIGHMSQKMLYGIEEFSLIFTWTRIWQMMFSVFCRIYLYLFLSNKSLIHSHNLSHEYRLQIISLQFSEYYKPHYLVQAAVTQWVK